MTILYWDKPAPIMSAEERAATYVADSAPPGVYVPNMSREDALRWKAKLTGHKAKPPHPQVEIRRAGLVIIVSLGGGYRYKFYGDPKRPYLATDGVNIHLASSGPQQMTFDSFAEMVQAIAEAREYLENLEDST